MKSKGGTWLSALSALENNERIKCTLKSLMRWEGPPLPSTKKIEEWGYLWGGGLERTADKVVEGDVKSRKDDLL